MAGKRSIFEEVGAGADQPPPQAGGIERGTGGGRAATRLWLLAVVMLVVGAILAGGLARFGVADPPGAGWRRIGQALGTGALLLWASGLVGLGLRGLLPPGWAVRLTGLGAALAGVVALAWLDPLGAPYLLALDLGLAFAALGAGTWLVMVLARPERDLIQARRGSEAGLGRLAGGLLHLMLVQVLLGGLLAGIDQGRGFPTWPLMNGTFLPTLAIAPPDQPLWRALVLDPGLVQFIHRGVGYLLVAFGALAWWRSRRSAHLATRGAFDAATLALLGQAVLGVATVLTASHFGVALTHLTASVLLWVLLLRARHLAQYPIAGSIRKGTQ